MHAALSHHPPGWPCMRLSRHDDVIARLGRQRSIDSRGGKASRANRATRREQFFCFSFGLQSSGFANGMLGMYFSSSSSCCFFRYRFPCRFACLEFELRCCSRFFVGLLLASPFAARNIESTWLISGKHVPPASLIDS